MSSSLLAGIWVNCSYVLCQLNFQKMIVLFVMLFIRLGNAYDITDDFYDNDIEYDTYDKDLPMMKTPKFISTPSNIVRFHLDWK